MIRKNIKTVKPLRMNMWRKVALSAWNRPNEPVIYCRTTLRPESAISFLEKVNKNSETRITMTHLIGKICGIILSEHEDLNSSILFKKAYVREGSDVFFHVSLIDENGKENLSGAKIDNCAKKTIFEISKELNREAKTIKKGEDITFLKIKKVMKLTPLFFVSALVRLTAFIQYRLNLWSPLLKTKQDSFGAMMLTNIGSLDFEEAFVPFSHYTNVNSIIAMGKIIEAPVIENGEVKVGLTQNFCWTIDHRVIDGSGGAKVLKTFKKYYENPELISEYEKNLDR